MATGRRRVAGRTTLTAIAREAGVSLATVSKVVNGRPDVGAETRARVQRLLLDGGYVSRNATVEMAAPRLSLELTFDSLAHPTNLEIARGATDAAQLMGLDIVLRTKPDDALGLDWAKSVAGARRAGVVMVTSTVTLQQLQQFKALKVPVVLIDPVNRPPASVPSIGATNWNGGVAAGQHLTALGHRRIGLITGRPDADCSMAREHGWRAALEEAGIAVDQGLIRVGDFRFPLAFEGAMDLLSQPDRPTAIFAGNDLEALAVIRAGRELGLRVPDDLSVVGFDDVALAQWSAPPLTTVRQPFAEMGRLAVQSALGLAQGVAPLTTRMELATELVVRQSTAPPPA